MLLISALEPQARARRRNSASRRHNLRQRRSRQNHHNRQHRHLLSPPRLLRRGSRLRRRPPQPRPITRPREPRQLHPRRGPQRRLPPRPGSRPGQAVVQFRAPLHLQAAIEASARVRRQGSGVACRFLERTTRRMSSVHPN
ncbi:hypothetical protein LINGRAHAP2_LOCUS17159 [Linum grandiflorum]